MASVTAVATEGTRSEMLLCIHFNQPAWSYGIVYRSLWCIPFFYNQNVFISKPSELYFRVRFILKVPFGTVNIWVFDLLLCGSQLRRLKAHFQNKYTFHSFKTSLARKPLFYKHVRKMVMLINLSRLVKFQNFLKILWNKIAKEKCSLFQ